MSVLSWSQGISGNTKGGTKLVSGHTADSKPVKQEVNGTVILPPLVFPAGVFVRGRPFQPGANVIKIITYVINEIL
jgi:hypothetical protein